MMYPKRNQQGKIMGMNDRMDEWSVTDLPSAALDESGRVMDIDDKWIARANSDLKKEAMKAWFLARYCDPAEETPYNGAEGGYIWIHGGPYHPEDELAHRFGGIVADDLIEEVVEELQTNMGDDWAPIQWDDDYDEDLGIEVENPKSPFLILCTRLNEIEEVEKLTGQPVAMALAQKLAYSAVLTAFESFLWETMVYAVDNDQRVVRNLITRHPEFRDRELKLGEIYEKTGKLHGEVKKYLQNIVWHRWDLVAPLFAFGLRIKPPNAKIFKAPIKKRHDIIHRSGHTQDGEPVKVEPGEVSELSAHVISFATDLETLVLQQYIEDAEKNLEKELDEIMGRPTKTADEE